MAALQPLQAGAIEGPPKREMHAMGLGARQPYSSPPSGHDRFVTSSCRVTQLSGQQWWGQGKCGSAISIFQTWVTPCWRPSSHRWTYRHGEGAAEPAILSGGGERHPVLRRLRLPLADL